MVPRLLKILNRDVASMNQAALVLAVFSFLSQVFGLLRDRLLATLVGPSSVLDVYYAAFRIPDFIYNSVAVLFSVTVLIPFITNYLHDTSEAKGEHLRRFSNSVFTVYVVGMMTICLIAFILMPILTRISAPGFSVAQHAELVRFSRLMLFSPFLMGLSSLLGSFAQVQKKFFSFAIAPVFYNVGILIGILAFRPIWGMSGVVLGVVLGALMYLLIQLPTLASLHKLPQLTRAVDWVTMKKVWLLSLPRTLASSLTNVTFLIITAIASLLVAGSLSIFQFSYNIQTTPLMIIGISYAVAAFPTLTRLFAEGDRKAFVDMIHRATRNIFFLSVPASLLIIVLRAQIVRVLLGSGEFSWNDTRLVAASVALFCISVTAQCMVLLLVRGFYAIGNTKTPLKINIIAVTGTIVAAGLLLLSFRNYPMFRDFIESLLRIDGAVGSSVVLLSLAFSIGQIGNAIGLWIYLHRHLRGHTAETNGMLRALLHMVCAGILAAAGAYGTLELIGKGIDQTAFIGVLLQGVVAGIVGVSIYAVTLVLLKNEDIGLFLQTLRSRFWKQKPLTPEQAEL